MDFKQFQLNATSTDQRKNKDGIKYLIPLLGLVGEIGSVVSEYKKRIRDGNKYRDYKIKLEEEIGDVLWYIATICSDMDIDLEKCAIRNINKTKERWDHLESFERKTFYDSEFDEKEQLPREFEITFKKNISGKIQMYYDNKPLGDPLTDNAYNDDGYRYHDAIHLSFVTVLGWSPVIRALMKRKRKSDENIDNIEDGARAGIIEEAISAIVYNYASRHSFLQNISTIDYDLLSTIKKLVSHLEVSDASSSLWEKAILQGYTIFNKLRQEEEGTLKCNLYTKKISFFK